MKTEWQDMKIGEGPAGRGMAAHDLQAGSIRGFLRRRPRDHPAAEGSLSLAQWEAQWQEFLRTLESPHSGWGSPHLPAKPSPWDDAKAFLASFEQVAEACQWPQEEWVTRLRPALSGEAEQAFNSLDVRDREDYGKVKAAILRGDVLSREKQRQQFRRFCYQEAEGPRGAYSQLREMCRGWLRVEKHSKEQILELLILEQLLTVLPPEIRSWVSEGGPESCSQAVALAEEFLLRQETQVLLEEASGRVSEAGQDPCEAEQGQLTRGLKEEEDGEASPLGAVEETIEEFQGFSLNKGKNEESKGNFGILTQPPRQEESHAEKMRNKPVPCQAGEFHEIPVRAERSPQKRRKEGHENASMASGTTFIQSMNVISHLDVPSREKPYSCLECGKGFSRRAVLVSHQRIHSAGDSQENEDDEDWLESSQDKAKDEELEGNFRNRDGPKRPEGSHTVEKRDKHIPCQREDFSEAIPMLEEKSKCLKSGMNFSDQSQYNIHSQKHNGKKTHKCLECGKCFEYTSHLISHQRIHTGERPFECSDCGKKFISNRYLLQHLRSHTGEKPSECSECGKKFFCNEALLRHLRRHRGEKPFECSDCGKKFNRSGHLQQHQRIHTGVKPFECSDCGKKFNCSGHLQQHQRIHTGVKPFECSDCGKKFNCNGHLQQHQRIHTGVKPFECSDCGKKFNRSGNLQQHQRIHTGVKPFECSDCGKKFNCSRNLQQHQRIHTGVKRFQCSDCGKKFFCNSYLLQHLRTHAGEKPFECSACGKKFFYNGDLLRHLRRHTGEKPFECSDCGKKFNRSGHLQRHQRIHTGVKPFECSDCGKKFNRSGNLQQHQRIHTGVKPFECSACGKSFNRKIHLHRHQRIHMRRNHVTAQPVTTTHLEQ
ncbi:zinc finger protein 345-like isoform X2 [Eublepharis macularius]|uniref:Zinc finger protein 345-like isoform X2 n=1 Tax=Eublepharis macularius TaxID=481883 RepID=A0AA97KXJ3_EUBMA|nr:zinc finger protein 345-like isoform X2 [Eublepharis macularius]